MRQSRGHRHPWSALLALSCCALLCGSRSERAIAAGGRNAGSAIAQALGGTHTTPWASTRPTSCGRWARAVCAATLGVWADRVVTPPPVLPETPEAARAVDGKTLRGSKQPGAPGPHLWAVLAHRLGVTLPHQAVAATTKEIKEVEPVCSPIVLTGRVVTMDARRTQRAVAQTIVDAGGD